MRITILSTSDAALRLGCSAERVRQPERTGRLFAEKTVRGQRIFKAEDVERLAAERERQRRQRQEQAAEKAA